jgi:hypothetical protein
MFSYIAPFQITAGMASVVTAVNGQAGLDQMEQSEQFVEVEQYVFVLLKFDLELLAGIYGQAHKFKMFLQALRRSRRQSAANDVVQDSQDGMQPSVVHSGFVVESEINIERTDILQKPFYLPFTAYIFRTI